MKNNLFKKYGKGFTLIELLVVIAIIGILTAIITANFLTAKSKARDAKRISDIAQLQLTLEQIFDKCSSYPVDIASLNIKLCTVNGKDYFLSDFISTIPLDPTSKSNYTYASSNNSNPLDYVLMAILENNNSILNDSVKDTVYRVNCNSLNYCIQPK